MAVVLANNKNPGKYLLPVQMSSLSNLRSYTPLAASPSDTRTTHRPSLWSLFDAKEQQFVKLGATCSNGVHDESVIQRMAEQPKHSLDPLAVYSHDVIAQAAFPLTLPEGMRS